MRFIGLLCVAVLSMGIVAAQTFGVVDLGKVINESELAKRSLQELRELEARYNELLQSLANNLFMVQEERQEFVNLQLSTTPLNDQQKKRIQEILDSAKRRAQDLADLRQKTTPTDAEKQRLNDLSQMETKGREALQALNEQLGQQLNAQLSQRREAVVNEIRKVVADVAKAQKVSVVFNADVATALAQSMQPFVLYCDKDLTDEVIKRLNAKK